MGYRMAALCSCGYGNKEVIVGSGRSGEYYYYPFYCKKCNILFSAASFECPKCQQKDVISYSDNKMYEGDNLADKGGKELIGRKFLCPSCGRYDLEFFILGF